MNLELKDIDFSFSLKTVLQKLNISFKEGQIHGLLGENGAGKSTTANIICGELKPSAGSIIIDGKPVIFNSPKDAIKQGISYVHQRPQLCENITAYENLLIGLNKQQKKNIKNYAASYIPDLKLSTPLYNVTSDLRFFLSLTNALLKEPELLILDEPSALLGPKQIEHLYSILCSLAEKGMNIIVITHSKEEAENYCNDVFYLKRNDTAVTAAPINQTKKSDNESFTQSDIKTSGNFECKWENISCKTRNHIPIKNLNFSVLSSEITLIKGYAEQGLTQLEDIICGMNKFKCQGTFSIIKNESNIRHNLAKNFSTYKLRYKSGITTGIIPTNKKYRGSNPLLSIKDMLCFNQELVSPAAIIEKSKINITENENCASLSGGMLQRLLINRELACKPQLLILCNPMQGLDNQSCQNVIKKLEKLKNENTAILVLSNSEFPEEICSKVYNLYKGEFTNV
ncbi:MAG: ATP-binding cassette domain-containing protein [Treponema sp.]|nr:ATP-binding cassette domain-containing protein [Treponema sp.]